MNSITSIAKFRQRVIRFSEKHGVTQASIRHRVSRNAIYEWKAKYDGNWKSLKDKSHRPKSHPNQHTQEYVPRLKRPEWATVGVLGKLIVYDDGTLQSGDMCRCGAGGKAVKSIKGGYPVLKRVSDDKVLIWFRG